MPAYPLLIAVLLAGAAPADPARGTLAGVVVNGSQQNAPLAAADVVLRVLDDGSPIPVAQTTTDPRGRFAFENLPLGQLVYLPGANRDGVHYPGPRVQLARHRERADVQIVAYDAVTEDSPLIIDWHEIAIRQREGLVEVTETLQVTNPSLTTWVGSEVGDKPPVTFKWPVFNGCETVTFHKEFFGRRFRIHQDNLITGIPWTPGGRQVAFSYELPIEAGHKLLQKRLPLPAGRVRICVENEDPDHAASNFPRVDSDPGEVVFEHAGSTLAAGQAIEIRLGKLPIPWIHYARWLAGALLLVLIGSLAVRRKTRKTAEPAAGRQSSARTDAAHRSGPSKSRVAVQRRRKQRR